MTSLTRHDLCRVKKITPSAKADKVVYYVNPL